MIRGFITNLGAYNEGRLIGEWITFPISDEDLEAVLEKIGIGPMYEEYFFTDWDDDADLGIADFLGEFVAAEKVNEIAEELGALNECDIVKMKAAIEYEGASRFCDVLYNLDNYDFYQGIYSDRDLGCYWLYESGCYNLDELGPLANYIDDEAFGRDIRLNEGGCFVEGGYIRCCA